MDWMKFWIWAVVTGVIIAADLWHKFYGIWSLVGYAVIAALIWFLLTNIGRWPTTVNPQPVQYQQWPIQEYLYWIVYHGTKGIYQALIILRQGIKPGDGTKYGVGVYMTFDFNEAQQYSKVGAAILKLYIRTDTNCIEWNSIPGTTPDEKHAWCIHNGHNMIYIDQYKWFVAIGQKGVPVATPGLAGVEVLDFHGNPINTN
jgi:hypothetical protein